MIGGKPRRFNPQWYESYDWLEYSVKVDKVFCLPCYLFNDHVRTQVGGDAFIFKGFGGWNKIQERLEAHIGEVGSVHSKAIKNYDALMCQDQSISVALHKQSDVTKNEYQIRLNASIDMSRYLLNGLLPFRGHDQSEKSFHRGHFLELMKYTQNQNESVRKVTLKNAPGNSQMVSPKIQKDISHCFAQEILKSILSEIGDDVFALLVDESSDVSKKEQMAVVLRYVERYVDSTCGLVKERFVGLVHLKETSALTLKSGIDSLLTEFGLSLQRVRGQGYDGASNMRGKFNGLKTLIMRENSSTYYVHCFAHQLQLVIVAIAKKHFPVGDFFDMVSLLINVVGGSCKRTDMIRDSQREKLLKEIGCGERETGSGLNKELSLIRAGDTRWSSHYRSLMRLVDLFQDVLDVLSYVEKDVQKRQANGLQIYLMSFDFAFYLHLMLHIFGLTESLTKALQRKYQEILNAISLVKSTKQQLLKFRIDGWVPLLEKIFSFCDKYGIEKLNMTEPYINPRNRRQKTGITYEHYYYFDCFNVVVDMQLAEFDDCFNEVNSELLIFMAALDPRDSFVAFDSLQLMRLVDFYPSDFSSVERMALEDELIMYIDNVKNDERFAHLNGISDLARVMVQTRKHLSYPLIYRLLKLALVLPVATTTVESCFSAMKLVKSDLCNRIGDVFLSDCLISAIEKEALANVSNDDVINHFQKMKTRREQL